MRSVAFRRGEFLSSVATLERDCRMQRHVASPAFKAGGDDAPKFIGEYVREMKDALREA